jgi:ubiquitin carboxyl-terminal hydrolase L5
LEFTFLPAFPPSSPPQQDAWLDAASAAVSERIARYSTTEQRFNLMAVVRSRLDQLEAQLAELDARRAALAPAVAGGDAAAAAELAALEGEAGEAGAALAAEGERRARWADENVRRRTDYIPFAFNLLEALAASGSLTPLLERADAERRAKAGAPAGPPQ